MTAPARQGEVSFWYADLGGLPARRPGPKGDISADVCIVGAGYTGLWTAYYLKQAAPELDVVIVEKEFAGFGASGRNGGWLTGGFAWDPARYLPARGRAGVLEMVRAMHGAVDEVVRVAGAEGIDADIHRTDELVLATNPAQAQRMRAEAARRAAWGEAERVGLLDAAGARERVAVPDVQGAILVRGVARIQPAKLVRGLAAAVERLGVRIYEGTPATGIAPGAVTTPQGTVRAGAVLRATEGFTAQIPGARRDWLPLNSAQVVTEPLPQAVWDRIGWQGGEIVGDFAHLYCYCQRTREGRIAVGGRGTPYRFGSRLDVAGRPDAATVRRLVGVLHRHFPAVREARIDHAWCGVLGVPRTGAPRWGSTAPPGWDGPGATWGSGFRPRTWRGGRWPTWCGGARRR